MPRLVQWQDTTLGKVAAEVTVGYVGPMADQYVASGVPFLRSLNVEPFRLNLYEVKYIGEEFHRKLQKSSLAPGDVVIVRTGKPGAAVVIPESLPVANCSDLVVVRPGPKLDPRFLVYYINSSAQHHISAYTVGAVQQHFNISSAKEMKLNLPPLWEQRAIARILGALDDKIELNRRMNHTLEEMARAIFKSWFVDFDPVIAKSEGRQPYGMNAETAALFPSAFQDSEMGLVPKGSDAVALPDLFEINPNRSLAKGQVAPYLEMSNMPTRGHAPDEWIDRPAGSGMRFINGDTLVARITPCLENGKTAFVDFLADGQVGWGSTEYIVLRPKPPLPLIFAYYLARTDGFRDFAIQAMTGSSGRQRVPVDSLDKYLFAKPSPEAAIAFGAIVDPLFAKARVNMQEIRTLAAIRDALLPKLLSGEIRVKDADKFVEMAT